MCRVKADVIFLVDCAVGLADDNFGIKQDLVFNMVHALHVAETNVRIAYLPYNTEVFEAFGFSHHRTKPAVLEQLGEAPVQQSGQTPKMSRHGCLLNSILT